MPIEHHDDLTQEFPEFKDRVQELGAVSPEFADMYAEYREVDNEIYRIEQGVATPSDHYTEELKKRRVRLKDRLYAMLRG